MLGTPFPASSYHINVYGFVSGSPPVAVATKSTAPPTQISIGGVIVKASAGVTVIVTHELTGKHPFASTIVAQYCVVIRGATVIGSEPMLGKLSQVTV